MCFRMTWCNSRPFSPRRPVPPVNGQVEKIRHIQHAEYGADDRRYAVPGLVVDDPGVDQPYPLPPYVQEAPVGGQHIPDPVGARAVRERDEVTVRRTEHVDRGPVPAT